MCRCLLAVALTSSFAAAAPTDEQLSKQFSDKIQPFLVSYCAGCHGAKSPAAQFTVAPYTSFQSVTGDLGHWAQILDRLNSGQMPPKGMKQPSPIERKDAIDWIAAVRRGEARKNAGDPGPVLARRLSNSEFNYTIRDLTGVDIQPAREFPVDPANISGFDNSGESLTMSPAMLNKYLLAAREISTHVALTPDGIVFAPHPMLVETDREKFAIQRIVDFYRSQPTDYAAYFEAAWRYKHRAKLGKPGATVRQVALDQKVSPQYLPMILEILGETAEGRKIDAAGPIAKLRFLWRNVPAPASASAPAPRGQFETMRDYTIRIRKHTAMQFAAPVVAGLPAASQPLLNWKLEKFASNRRKSDPAALRNDTDPPPALAAVPRYAGLHREAATRWAAVMAVERAGDSDLIVPAAERARYEAAFARFANVFPDVFYVSERGRFFPDDSEDPGRLLSAGYHNTMGYFRDDQALMELILDDKGRAELDRLWLEFDYIGKYTERTWDQFFFNQSGAVDGKGAESGSPRPTDAAVASETVVFRMRDRYAAKAKANPSNDPIAVQAIEQHFAKVNGTLRMLEKLHVDSEPRHVESVVALAARAWRRPLTGDEKDTLHTFYRKLRDTNGLSHEDAVRDLVVTVLMSPNFNYRVDMSEAKPPAASKPSKNEPLSQIALANRLSYFLWSSMPDEELLAHATNGDLTRRDVLLGQTRRMLKDPRVRALALEFAGNWLDFRQFEQHNAVDRERFPAFNDDLRSAMFEEPVRLIEDALRNDRSAYDMLFGTYTFVNPVLAKHYGMSSVKGGKDRWVRVDNADAYGRGGLLPMSVFLTRNSPGLRTSPVKRGYWVVRRVLGEQIPPPPPNVPELPEDEASADLPLRDMLAKHRDNAACASCHARFDSYGLVFEGYGPVGERRSKDLAGRPVDVKADITGSQIDGFEGLRNFIRDNRQREYLETLSRMLLSFALNRSPILSDDELVERMLASAAADGARFQSLIETIVTSPQFLNRRSDPGRLSQSEE